MKNNQWKVLKDIPGAKAGEILRARFGAIDIETPSSAPLMNPGTFMTHYMPHEFPDFFERVKNDAPEVPHYKLDSIDDPTGTINQLIDCVSYLMKPVEELKEEARRSGAEMSEVESDWHGQTEDAKAKRINELEQENAKLKAEVEEYRDVLEFYAQPYGQKDEYGDDIHVPELYDEMDFEKKAKDVLAKHQKKEGG